MKMCTVGGKDGPDYDCVLDESCEWPIDDCDIAIRLQSKGKSRDDCEYWQEVDGVEPKRHKCPECGYRF